MKRLLIVLLLGVLAAVLVACSSVSGGASSSGKAPESSNNTPPAEETKAPDPGEAEYQEACAPFDAGKYYSAKVAFENSGYDDWEKRAAECVQTMPATGELWHNESMKSDAMYLNLTVSSEDSNVGRYFAIYTDKKELAATIFIKGEGTVQTHLPGGNYYIKDASGTEWYGDIELFGADGHYENMVFDEVDGDRYLTVLDEGYEWSITVNTSSSEGQGVGSEETDWEDWG